MSKSTAMVSGLAGAGIGALVGLPYLLRTGDCSLLAAQSLGCTVEQTFGPFLIAIAAGFVVAMLVGEAVAIATRHMPAPPGPGDPERSAVGFEEPVGEIAAWGIAPGAGRRNAGLAEPMALPTRSTGKPARARLRSVPERSDRA